MNVNAEMQRWPLSPLGMHNRTWDGYRKVNLEFRGQSRTICRVGTAKISEPRADDRWTGMVGPRRGSWMIGVWIVIDIVYPSDHLLSDGGSQDLYLSWYCELENAQHISLPPPRPSYVDT